MRRWRSSPISWRSSALVRFFRFINRSLVKSRPGIKGGQENLAARHPLRAEQLPSQNISVFPGPAINPFKRACNNGSKREGREPPTPARRQSPSPNPASISYKPFQNLFFCHPERSEGSQRIENTRFFASLRMTG